MLPVISCASLSYSLSFGEGWGEALSFPSLLGKG